jgi:hypothetical protein
VTGEQVLTIMLRALGYGQNGEFQGEGWAQRVVSTAREQGLLTGIATDNLSQGATRELVSQLIFNSLTQTNMVYYNSVRGYVDTDAKETLGHKTFGLNQINGVITANEYASLTADEPLAANKTTVGDKTYNVSTDLTQIGMSYVGWAYGKDANGNDLKNQNVLYFVDSGNNTVYETGAATDISNSTKFKKVTGLTDEAQYFVDFGNDSVWTSDHRIRYEIGTYVANSDAAATDVGSSNAATATAAAIRVLQNDLGRYADYFVVDDAANISIAAVTDRNSGEGGYNITYSETFKPDAEIDADAQTNIQAIFNYADRFTNGYVYGEVYVNTTSLVDVSDTMSFKQFMADYIDAGTTQYFGTTKNGEWLKVIDNNGDGAADYAFKTQFNVDVVSAVNAKTGAVTMTTPVGQNATTGTPIYTISSDDLSTSDELTKGDVVIWDLIDGVYHVCLADSFEAQVSSYSWKNDEITTTDGETYGQSGIGNSNDDVSGALVNVISTDLVNALDKTNYVFYKDFFGYVVAFDETTLTNGLVLLTDGAYTYGLNKKDTYSIEYWDNDAAKFATANVDTSASVSDHAYWDAANNKWDNSRATIGDFIYNDSNAVLGLSYGWERLIGAVDGAWTNVAAVALSDNGATVKDVNAKSNKTITYTTELDATNGFAGSTQPQLTATEADHYGHKQVMTNSSTVFYYVYKAAGSKTMTITTKVGYTNSVKVAADDIHAAYAVVTDTNSYNANGTNATAGGSYPVADVVVIEINKQVVTSEMALIYSVDSRTSSEIRALNTIVSGAEKDYTVVTDGWDAAQYASLSDFTFQTLTLNGEGKVSDTTLITAYKDNGIKAGQINATNGVYMGDAPYVILTNGQNVTFNTNTPILTFAPSSRNNTYTFSTDTTLRNGDELIYVTSGNKVQYIIDVTQSTDSYGSIIYGLRTLYNNIATEKTTTTSITVDGTQIGTGYTVGATKTVGVSAAAGNYVRVTSNATKSDGTTVDPVYVKVSDTKTVDVTVTGDMTVDGKTAYVPYTVNGTTYYGQANDPIDPAANVGSWYLTNNTMTKVPAVSKNLNISGPFYCKVAVTQGDTVTVVSGTAKDGNNNTLSGSVAADFYATVGSVVTVINSNGVTTTYTVLKDLSV